MQIVPPPPNALGVIRGLFGPLIGPLGTAGIVVVFVIFMLLQREDLRDRLVRLLGAREMHTTVRAIEDAASRVSRFLLMQTIINTIQGVLVATGLYFLGVPDALLWGALTIVLRFIPYLGPLLAAVGPIALSVAFFDNWTYPLLVVALIVALELISNNVLEPWLYGSSVGVSSFALIVAAVFWTWLWGTAGLFLAIPLTVCLVIMGKYIPQLEFLSVLLSDQPGLKPEERFYQRLLSNNAEDAEDLLEEELEQKSLLEVCDTIVLPRSDLPSRITTAVRLMRISGARSSMKSASWPTTCESRTRRNRRLPPSRRSIARGVKFTVLCLPAADRADEVGAQLFVKIDRAKGTRGSGGLDHRVEGRDARPRRRSEARRNLHLRHAARGGDPRALSVQEASRSRREYSDHRRVMERTRRYAESKSPTSICWSE